MSLISLPWGHILGRRVAQLVINNKRVNIVTRSTIIKLIKLSIHHEVFFNLLAEIV
jgi:hypothetical protein